MAMLHRSPLCSAQAGRLAQGRPTARPRLALARSAGSAPATTAAPTVSVQPENASSVVVPITGAEYAPFLEANELVLVDYYTDTESVACSQSEQHYHTQHHPHQPPNTLPAPETPGRTPKHQNPVRVPVARVREQYHHSATSRADARATMLGDLDMLQCAQKDAPTMRRLSVELSHNNHNAHSNNISPSNAKDIPGGPGGALRRLSSSSVSSARSSMSSDGAALSPTFSSMSSSMPNAFYLDRVSSLLGRASSLPADRGVPGALPSIPGSAHVAAAASIAAGLPASPARPPMLQVVGSAPAGADSGLGSTRASALIRSLSKGMDSFR